MALYAYKAIDAGGRRSRGQIDASNLADLESRLSRLGLELIDCREVGARSRFFGGNRVSRQELITFCFHMEQMAAAGVPVLEGLTDLRDSFEDSPLKRISADLTEAIRGGMQLSAALGRHPKVFPPVLRSLVYTGEVSGELPAVFAKLTHSLKWEDELAAQTKRLITYPVFAGLVVGGVSLFLLMYLVPQLASFIRGTGQELPWQTAMLLAFSEWLVNYWYLLPMIPILAFVAFKGYANSSPRARQRIDGWKMKLWVVGPILRKVILARFAGYFAMMYAAGVTVLESLTILEGVVGNRAVSSAIKQVHKAIMDGTSITDAFQSSGLFPPLVIRMLKIGETTGELDAALANVSYFYGREVKESIERLQTLIEPVLTVILGLVLGWIMISVLGPIYDIITKLKI